MAGRGDGMAASEKMEQHVIEQENYSSCRDSTGVRTNLLN